MDHAVALSPPPSLSRRAGALRLSARVELGVAGLVRAELSPTLGPELGLGIGVGAWRLGVIGSLPGSSDLEALGEERRVEENTARAGLWWAPVPLAALGGGAALSRRVYTQAEIEVQRQQSPALWAEARLEPRLSPHLRPFLALSASRELGETELWVGEAREGALARWSAAGSLGLVGVVAKREPPPR